MSEEENIVVERLCECGCGQRIKANQRFIRGHNVKLISDETKKKGREKASITRKITREIMLGIRPPPEPVLCGCGCGKETRAGNRYILGHNQRGIHHSEAHKKYLSEINTGEKHPMYGTHPSEESKQKMSDSHMGNPGFWTGKKFSEEHVKNMSKTHMGNPGFWTGKPRSEETKELISIKLKGDKNSNWKGGIANFPYCEKFSYDFRERVREFFGRCCYLCAKNEMDNGQKLSVHHVNYDKMVCCNDVKPLFVPLCRNCHSKVHYDREEWEKLFTLSLDFLTGGKCFTPKGDI